VAAFRCDALGSTPEIRYGILGESGPIMSINCRKTIKISFSQDGENGFFTLLYSDNLAAGL